LIQLNSDICISVQTNPSEIVTVLSRGGLFFNALNICEIFNLNKSLVLENLVSECIKLNHTDNSKIWNWLYLNDISDFCIFTVCPSKLAWNLLKNTLLKYEEKGKSDVHKVITKKLYQLGSFLPRWLYYSYAKQNTSEFLRLMIQMGKLEEATDFAINYIQTILSGKGSEYFGLPSILLTTASSVCTPFNTIEILLSELEFAIKDDKSYLKMYELLKNAMDNYLKTVERVSKNMIALKNTKNKHFQ